MTNIAAHIRHRLAAWLARWPEQTLRAFLGEVITKRAQSVPPAQGLRFLFRLDDAMYSLLGGLAVDYGEGLHTKHRHTKYHDFFVERIHQEDRVLDIGCGNGALAKDIAERSGAHVTAIDLSERNINLALKHYDHPRVTYAVGDALDLCSRSISGGQSSTQKNNALHEPHNPHPAKHNVFSVIVLSNVLEHLENRVDFLVQLKTSFAQPIQHTSENSQPTTNLAQPITHNPQQFSPRFLIRVPLFERDWRVPLKKELGLEWRLDPGHKTEYTQESFAEEMAGSGLAVRHQEIRWGEIWAEAVPAD